MFIIHHAWRRDGLEFAGKEQRLRVAVPKWLQHLVPVQQFDVDVGECQLVIEFQTRSQCFIGKEFTRGATKSLGTDTAPESTPSIDRASSRFDVDFGR